MKKTFLLPFVLLLLVASPVHAQTDSTGSGGLKGKIKQEIQDKVAKKRKENLNNFVTRVIKRLNDHLKRQDKLADRIQTRINKLKGKGADTGKAQSQLDQTRALIGQARVDTAKLQTDAVGIIETNQPKEAFSQLKTRITVIKRELVDISKHLASSLGLVKGLSNEAKEGKESTSSGK